LESISIDSAPSNTTSSTTTTTTTTIAIDAPVSHKRTREIAEVNYLKNVEKMKSKRQKKNKIIRCWSNSGC